MVFFFFTVQLDAGVDEKVMLISRDEQSCLIVSYREVSCKGWDLGGDGPGLARGFRLQNVVC